MTDKTDIAALREECAQWVKDTFGESIDTRMALNGDGTDYMQYDMAAIWRAWHHLSRKLDAERQQAAETNNINLNIKLSLHERMVKAEKEVAALKDEQVPVGWEVCSPEWCGRTNACGTAPRIWFASKDGIGPHYHPSEFTAPQQPLYSPVGEIVAWSGTNRDMGITRDIDFRFFRFDVLPGTKLYAAEPVPMVTDEMALAFHFATTDGAAGDDDVDDIKIGLMAALSAAPKRGGEQAPAVKSDLLSRAEALAVETRALATRIQDGE